ncbi:3-deoxy-manno-octulosonate cytidylyltransferase [Aestuariibacter sp. GS-14]|uniref:3-deoxy-manno-octulosonate cytidylyltransferase n=1 Tax=Aestuariibacter sp. GS-14 TaxID=2590670 RepID=UPI00112880DB|nr:3-deoxy-manno-octulosonate cytidylyltransferase [Aestuariibacter sp. GS-14]TPV55123.1 3-deoxy-manno-octulosonate cytidylyltransferase [Aestuariibacter sp. GS-14]
MQINNTVAVVIPARYESTRYPGKPLVKLLGKPMILWVAELSAKAVGNEHVYIATDDERIKIAVESAGFKVVMTGPALTGTDRLAEAAELITADIIVNVQGDEPLVDPDDIKKIANAKHQYPNMIINGFSYLNENEKPQNVNIPKVITTEENNLVYMSRLPIPGFKDLKNAPASYKKQVCIYAFNKSELKLFRDFGRKSTLEHSEDIEILRFLEFGTPIKMIETKPGSYAVDAPEDVAIVEAELRKVLSS